VTPSLSRPLRLAASALRTRAALGLGPITAPVTLFVPLGALLGPAGAGVVAHEALAYLDVVVSIALATLGIFIGIAAGDEGRHHARLFAAASAEAAVTIAVVTGATWFLLNAWQLPLDVPYALAAVAMGVCAAASAAPFVELGHDRTRQIAARVADLDDVLPIVAGGVIVAAIAGTKGTVADTGAALLLAAVIAFSGWLLFEHATDQAERGVFVLGALALLGGSAAYLDLSPLFIGLCAGWLWVLAPGGTDALVARELQKVQHPLVVLLLVTAGASLEPSTAAVWLFAVYVAFRLAGKLIGGWTASRIAPDITPSELGAYLIPSGVIGIAFALNLQQIDPAAASPLLFAVAAGAVACEIIAALVTAPVERR
jgi:hypothetical protein